mmetsp:Transcript_90003/g.234307  ORF Transcript_90003/g.234307 Transcript_90003/m.234307 type:complete len:224 (+) Transcript_90003:141-812(+)
MVDGHRGSEVGATNEGGPFLHHGARLRHQGYAAGCRRLRCRRRAHEVQRLLQGPPGAAALGALGGSPEARRLCCRGGGRGRLHPRGPGVRAGPREARCGARGRVLFAPRPAGGVRAWPHRLPGQQVPGDAQVAPEEGHRRAARRRRGSGSIPGRRRQPSCCSPPRCRRPQRCAEAHGCERPRQRAGRGFARSCQGRGPGRALLAHRIGRRRHCRAAESWPPAH